MRSTAVTSFQLAIATVSAIALTVVAASRKWGIVGYVLDAEPSDISSRLAYERSIRGTNIDDYGTVDIFLAETALFAITLVLFAILAALIARKHATKTPARLAVYGVCFGLCFLTWRIFAPSDTAFVEGIG